MRVKLLRQHVINGTLYEKDVEIELQSNRQVTPFMEPLDDEALVSIRNEIIRVYGRWIDPQHTILLDDPPIPRPDGEEQPVPHIPGTGGPTR